MVKQINLTELKSKLETLLEDIESGDEVIVLREGQPAFKMTKIEPSPARRPIKYGGGEEAFKNIDLDTWDDIDVLVATKYLLSKL